MHAYDVPHTAVLATPPPPAPAACFDSPPWYAQVQKALIDMENMFELLNTASRVGDVPGAKELVVTQAEVAFDRVVFGYSPSNPVLKGVSFTVPGECS